jgi:GR25 family glycosyltransferase involved in LPS biosynthesis
MLSQYANKKFVEIKDYIHENIEYLVFFIVVLVLFLIITKRNWENFTNLPIGVNKLDAIIYINLENRNDRKDLLLNELKQIDVKQEKIHKVSGVYIPKNGHKGCIQSHIIALQMIKMNNWRRVLILEDDAKIIIPFELFNEVLENALNTLDNYEQGWNVLMLATANKQIAQIKVIPLKNNHINTTTNANTNANTNAILLNNDDKDDKDNKDDKYVIPDSLERLIFATTASAYIVNANYVDTILELFNTCNKNMNSNKLTGDNYEYWALDQKWEELQKKDKWFCFSHDIITQRNIWSTTMQNSHY